MKALCMGDFHGHLFTDFAEVDEITGNSRFTQQLKALQYMRSYCLDNGIKLVLFAGDMYHKRVTVNTVVYNAIRDEIKKFGESGITVVMTVGNHDQVDNSDYPQHSLHSFKELYNVHVLDSFNQFYFEDGVNVYSAPYSKNAQLVKDSINNFAESIKLDRKAGGVKSAILLGHLGVSGAYVGKGNYAMADAFSVDDLRPDVFDFGVFGHFHKRQFLGGHPNYFYTGSPLQHSFNDEGEEKGFYIIDTETGEVEFNEVPAPKFITVTDYKNANMVSLAGNFVRFQCDVDDVEDLSSKIPVGLKHRTEPQKTYKEEKRVDVEVGMALTDVIKAYADKFKPEALEVGLDILREMEQN